jgi:hypothetical protein
MPAERARVRRADRRSRAVRWKDGLDAAGIRTAPNRSRSRRSDFEYVEAGPSIVLNKFKFKHKLKTLLA